MIPPDSARAAEPRPCKNCGEPREHANHDVAHGCIYEPRAAESEESTPVRFALVHDGRVAGVWSTREGARKACAEWNAARYGYTVEPLYIGSTVERLRAEVAAAREREERLALIGAQFANFAHNVVQVAAPPDSVAWLAWRATLDTLRKQWDAARSPSTPDTPEKP